MPHVLKNNNVEIYIDLPQEGYQLSRFDWTGKITWVKFKNKLISGIERTDKGNGRSIGKGFYNEFGITQPIGFDEIEIGEWFQKIGVGLLKKDGQPYDFFKIYPINPAVFKTEGDAQTLKLICSSKMVNGYGYLLEKNIVLLENGFEINYYLKNTGSKNIKTDEYIHNFICIDQDLIGKNYTLKFPINLEINKFDQYVNEENKLEISENKINFNGTPEKQFFISNILGSKLISPSWELINHEKKLSICETVSFKTVKTNLWGWRHVISPEIFFKINLKSGESVNWSRFYKIHELD